MEDAEFASMFERYMTKKREKMKSAYNRVLPTGELIFNRFTKADYLNAGEGTSVYDTSVVMGNVVIGKNTWIGPYTLLEGANGNLVIGDNCSIDTGACIYTHDTTCMQVSIRGGQKLTGNVTIGNNTVIGTHAMVSYGVTIGKHCVIGAYTMVKSDIPDFSIAVGVPAKVIGQVKLDNEGRASFHYF